MTFRSALLLGVATAAIVIPAHAQVINLDEVVVAQSSDPVAAAPSETAPASIAPAATTVAASEGGAAPVTAAEEAAFAAVAPVSVVTRDDIALTGQTNVSDALQTVPGVLVPQSPDDPAVSVNIRGVQDFGRVIVSIDGARQNFARSGHGSQGSFYIDGDLVKAITVTRGPATVVGGGAIGGLVEFVTIDADDVLKGDENVAARAKAGFLTTGAGATVHGEVATRIGEAFDVVLAGTVERTGNYRDGDGDEILSASRLLSGLLKARLRLAPGHETTVSAMRVANDFDSGTSTVRETTAIADTVTLTHTYSGINPLLDVTARAYYTETDVNQEDVIGTTPGLLRQYNVATIGGELYNIAEYDALGLANTTTVGGDLFRDTVTTHDDAGYANDSTPPGNREVYGAYIQHKAERGWFELVGALRLDAYHLAGTVEETGEEVDKDGAAVTPKITAAVNPMEGLTVYASYAEAYRPPSLTESLVQGTHPPPATFLFIPNPNLNPETAHNFEVGINVGLDDLAFAGDRLRFKASAFHNEVSDYIDLKCEPFKGECTYINLDEAVLRGVELEASYDMGRFYAILTGTYIESENLANGDPLANVQPPRVSATLGARALEGKLDIGTTFTLVDDAPNADVFGLSGAGYGLLDAYASYAFDDDTAVTLTLNNILDREYTQYLDLQPSPGFAARLTFERRFGTRSTAFSERTTL
ncbi:MAG: TonB-dependent hemoglobin/transferrin/lactoferrin family receptor [Acuticoccus sp.]